MAFTLPLVTLIDELWSGVAVTGAPSVERELGVSHTGYLGLAFVGPLILAAVLEAGVSVYSDVADRKRLVLAGQATLAGALFVLAFTKNPWIFTAALAIAGTGSGVGCSAAQAMLVRERPAQADAVMLRWTLFAAAGDVLAPIVTGGAIAYGLSYRGAMLVVAVVVVLQCVGLVRAPQAPTTGETPDEDETPPLREALKRAVRSPRLWVWLVAAASCTLLDELVVALAALRLAREQGSSIALATGAAVTFSVGSLVGVAVTERARWNPRTVLVTSAILCLASLGGLVLARGVLATGIALFAVGLTCAPHHALALARAYRAMPKNPGVVQALGQLSVLADVGAPLVLGIVADRFGLGPALACLAVQPLVVAACAALGY